MTETEPFKPVASNYGKTKNRVVCCRLAPEDAERFDAVCRENRLRQGTLARQMILHCLDSIDQEAKK